MKPMAKVMLISILFLFLISGCIMNKNGKETKAAERAADFMKKEASITFIATDHYWADKQAGELLFVNGYDKDHPDKKYSVPVQVDSDYYIRAYSIQH